MSVRIGAVGYLNARPLTWALDRDPARWAIRYDLPAVCAALLQAGEVDLGLTPSIEYLHDPRYRFVPGIGIGARGPVTSVAIFSTRPMADVRSIALDTSSRTSVALTRVLCHDWFKIAPAFVPQGPSLEAMTATKDAALLIGDPALRVDRTGLHVIDLAAEWRALTGLPFVFAVWAVGPDVEPAVAAREVAPLLAASLAAAEANLDELVATAAAELGLPADEVRTYLTRHLSYRLGEAERASLEEFFRRAHRHGLLPAPRPLRWVREPG